MRGFVQRALRYWRIPLCQGKTQVLDLIVELVLGQSFGLLCSFSCFLHLPVRCDVFE